MLFNKGYYSMLCLWMKTNLQCFVKERSAYLHVRNDFFCVNSDFVAGLLAYSPWIFNYSFMVLRV
jgi:hypothetical protein